MSKKQPAPTKIDWKAVALGVLQMPIEEHDATKVWDNRRNNGRK